MKSIEELLSSSIEELLCSFNDAHPTAAPVLYFVVTLVLLLAIAWFLLFSGLNTSADFVYNQF